MFKTILKETAISLLLIVAIGILLAIIFYSYLPLNKILPAQVVAQELPADIKEELSQNNLITTQNVLKTYTVESQDLYMYEINKAYDKGKENPFAMDSRKVNNTITDENGNTEGSGNGGGISETRNGNKGK